MVFREDVGVDGAAGFVCSAVKQYCGLISVSLQARTQIYDFNSWVSVKMCHQFSAVPVLQAKLQGAIK